MAALISPRRSHFAIKFTAGVMRVASVVFLVGGLLGALVFQTQTQAQTAASGLPVVVAGVAGVFFFAFTIIYAVILWGLADALVLISDTYDAQRTTQALVDRLITERQPVQPPPTI